jgi:hypothetical protein
MKYDEALYRAAVEKERLVRITDEHKIRRLAFTNTGDKTDVFVQVLKDGSIIPWQSTTEDRKSNDWRNA